MLIIYDHVAFNELLFSGNLVTMGKLSEEPKEENTEKELYNPYHTPINGPL